MGIPNEEYHFGAPYNIRKIICGGLSRGPLMRIDVEICSMHSCMMYMLAL